MDQPNQYKLKYTELKTIGSGNFGSATLISPKSDPSTYYVAKKVLLNKIKDNEKFSAKQEAELLKQLKHPHIVEYIDSFIEEGFFIIVMEYCEEGDLAYHIKKMREKMQHFTEELILNWFLQIVFALGYVHSKKILHRDIKSSNIFLTSHGFVKLGDFGISKILEGTMEAADTVIGTPYYMSPEVCENTPYSYKSDVWALGCVLYELCTLKHAFSASNLLGLVYKIIQEKQEPIPSFYSEDLKKLVSTLLTKSHKARPDIGQILQYGFVKEVARKFVERKGEMALNFTPVIKPTEVHLERELTDLGEIDLAGKTPKEKIEIKRRREAEKKKELINQAIMENLSGKVAVKDRRLKELQSSMDAHKYYQQSKAMGASRTVESMQGTLKNQSNIIDKSQEFYGEGTLESKYEQTRGAKSKMDQTYKDYPTQTIASMVMETDNYGQRLCQGTSGGNVMANSGLQNKSGLRESLDDRPIRASGQYNLAGMDLVDAGEDTIMGETLNTMEMTSVPKGKRTINTNKNSEPEFDNLKTQIMYDMKLNEKVHDEYPEDFEDVKSTEEIDDLYDDADPSYRLTQKSGAKELTAVMKEYQEFISKSKDYQINNSSHFSDLSTIRESKNESGTTASSVNNTKNRTISTQSDRIDQAKTKLVNRLGEKLYNELYKYLSYHRKHNTPDAKIQKHLRENYDRAVLGSIFEIDQIVFLESGSQF